jgi:hypothetical protein
LLAQRTTLVQQFRQCRLDTRLPVLRRQVQYPHVLPVRSSRLLRQQGVVGTSKGQRRVQIFTVHVTRERPGLSHQPVDHVPIIDPMVRLTTQTLHRLHQRACVPHLDRLGAESCFHPFPTQSRRHRVGVLLHLNRAALAHPHTLSFQRLQPTRRQQTQPCQLLLQLLRPAIIPPTHQRTQPLPVLLATGEVPTATQQQFLLHCLLETSMTLLAVAVLVPAVRIGRLGRHAIVTHQGLIPRRVLLGIAIVVNGQRHAISTMTLRHRAQLPQGVLPAHAEAGEALREAQRHVFPVRIGQHEVVQHMRQRLTLDGHTQLVHVREVRRAQPARFMHLTEKHFLGRTMLGLPLPYPPFYSAAMPLPVLVRIATLQPFHQRLGLQTSLTLQQPRQRRPNIKQRIRPGPPRVWNRCFAGQLAQVAILACRFGMHTCFHRRPQQRCPLVKVPPNFLDLRIRHLASSTHWQLLLLGCCQCSRLQLRV